jgi:hypothetical protein
MFSWLVHTEQISGHSNAYQNRFQLLAFYRGLTPRAAALALM